MPITAIAAIAVFVILFSAWVIIPARVKKHHEEKVEE